MGIRDGINKVKNVVDNATETMDQINNVVNTVKNPQKAAASAKNTRDTKDAERIYNFIDERENEINEVLNSEEVTQEDRQALTDYLERLEELRDKTKNRVHKRLMEDREFEHKVNKDMADINIRQQEVDAKKVEAQASMVRAKNEGLKAIGIFSGNVIGNALSSAVMLHGIHTGAAVEMYQGGSITSSTGKNQMPKFADVTKVLYGPRGL
jgi:flagellin-like hook-associated protein FlgL